MSGFNQIENGLPNPFNVSNKKPAVGVSRTVRVANSQEFAGSSIELQPGQITSTLVINSSGANTYTLPSGTGIYNAFGGQVSYGDVFALPYIIVGTGSITFQPGTGNTGTVAVATGPLSGNLIIKAASDSVVSYTIA